MATTVKRDVKTVSAKKNAVTRGKKLPPKTRINLTADDIEHGKLRDDANCPAARAIARTLQNTSGIIVKYVRVNRETIHFTTEDGRRLSVSTPKPLTAVIDRYDKTEKMAPFAFDLDTTKAEEIPTRRITSYDRIGKPRPKLTPKTKRVRPIST